jgi:micrococcal nuclease
MKYIYKAIVKSVLDGDTVKVDIDLGFGIWLKDQNVRLLKINAPEIKGESKSLGMKSKERLSELLLNKEIKLETSKDKKEKYGRWLGLIVININNEEICINDLMISEGYANSYL